MINRTVSSMLAVGALFGIGLVVGVACSSETTNPNPTPSSTATSTASAQPTPTATSTAPAPATVTVTIPQNAMTLGTAAFGQNPLTINAGDTVMWMNADSIAHTATSDTGVFDSGIINAGAMFQFTFPTAGTFPYHCAIHGKAAMSGTIVVQAAATSSGGSSSGGGGGGY
jgi:plastocyanin